MSVVYILYVLKQDYKFTATLAAVSVAVMLVVKKTFYIDKPKSCTNFDFDLMMSLDEMRGAHQSSQSP